MDSLYIRLKQINSVALGVFDKDKSDIDFNTILNKKFEDKDMAYTFSYRYLTYLNDKCVLEGSIDTKYIVDNRR